ncbi:c-type cytochrome [Bradyrhizobium sp. G127]|jgi:mono/diheme cytochrome c family protein|uniref:c-type cytochrome n=1 Tax=Bradyrhizobium sp. G127 TaxID=2904800 RepID=UPI001F235DCD|nr:c-type cytochrome [Bradyrhizobium sp. G127]MCF2521533.1 cytochrome c [Bradyrhizobium sp. G127]
MSKLQTTSVRASIFTVGIIVSLAALQSSGKTQEFGDPVQGAILTQKICSTCHGVARGEASPNPAAPNFNHIAGIKGMSATALNVALLTPHHQMPNLILTSQERADVIAFILGLKEK